jgi:hypothetical protein
MNGKTDVLAVYVHLGTSFPKHLELNLRRHRKLFPLQEVYLIVEDGSKPPVIDGLKYFYVNLKNIDRELFAEMSKYLDFDFRDGFWKYTLQRLFAIGVLHAEIPICKLLHIESDVLIMADFPWDRFSAQKTLSWLSVSDTSDVAAVVYFPTASETLFLMEQIRIYANADPSINDMFVLRRFAKDFPSRHAYLPSLNSRNMRNWNQLNSESSRLAKGFDGIFDPLALGLWYFGQDPKNSFGFVRRYTEDTSHFMSGKNSYLQISDGFLTDMDGIPIYSLHVHSKRLDLFSENWESAMSKALSEARTKSKRIRFDKKAFKAAVSGRTFKSIIWEITAHSRCISLLRKFRFFDQLKVLMKKLIRP